MGTPPILGNLHVSTGIARVKTEDPHRSNGPGALSAIKVSLQTPLTIYLSIYIYHL